jgi:hypothetical protein
MAGFVFSFLGNKIHKQLFIVRSLHGEWALMRNKPQILTGAQKTLSMNNIMENWKIYEQQILWEQDFDQFFNEHFTIVDEGVVDWVVAKGSQIKDTVVNVIAGMKDWANEKITAFVKFMANKLKEFIKALNLGKYKTRNEIQPIDLLMEDEHVDLAVMIFSAIAKLTGGFVVDKVMKVPKIIETIRNLLEDPLDAFKELIGDVSDIATMVKKFIEYRKALKSYKRFPKHWHDVGGFLAVERQQRFPIVGKRAQST